MVVARSGSRIVRSPAGPLASTLQHLAGLGANPSIQGTVEKLRFSIPSVLRASAAPDLER